MAEVTFVNGSGGGTPMSAANFNTLKSGVFRPCAHFGAVGNGVADDTTAVQAAFTAASALSPPGTVEFESGKTHKITASLIANCNIRDAGASLVYSGSTTDPALTIGNISSFTSYLECYVPYVYRATRSWGTVGAADVGVRCVNLDTCRVTIRGVNDFTAGLQIAGKSTGCSYNTFFIGALISNKVNLHLTTLDNTGWANENIFIGGRVSHDSAIGTGVSGCRQILIDCFSSSSGPGAANNCTFEHISIEGNVPEFHIETKGAGHNIFNQLRYEASAPKIWINQYSSSLYTTRTTFNGGYNLENVVFTHSANSTYTKVITDGGGMKFGAGDSLAPLVLTNDGSSGYPVLLTTLAGALWSANPATEFGVALGHQYTRMKRETDTQDRIRLDHIFGKIYLGAGTTYAPDVVLVRDADIAATLQTSGPFRTMGALGPMISAPVFANTYSASITPDAANGQFQKITATNTTAFTINAPTHPNDGQELTFDIKNSSGGAMGVITWNAVFLLAGTFTNPANTKRRTISFYYDGTSWIELTRAAADI